MWDALEKWNIMLTMQVQYSSYQDVEDNEPLDRYIAHRAGGVMLSLTNKR